MRDRHEAIAVVIVVGLICMFDMSFVSCPPPFDAIILPHLRKRADLKIAWLIK